MPEKESAPSCERNRAPILVVLAEIFHAPGVVLEIASGTGQHAAWFAQALPELCWQPTELAEHHDSINAWRLEATAGIVRPPLVLDLGAGHWPVDRVDYVVCINTIHIVSWPAVERLFAGAGSVLPVGGLLYVYGPYRYAHRPLEPSNEQFDAWLKRRDPRSGIRDFDAVDALARNAGFELVGDRAMPANNRSIWWRRVNHSGFRPTPIR